MKSLLVLALLGGLGFVGYKYWYKGGGPASPEAKAKFIESCKQLSTTVAKVGAYCDCLANNGVTRMTALMTDPASRTVVATCQAQTGNVAPPPAQPRPGAGPAPSGRGINADHLSGQLKKAYERRPAP